MNNKTEERKWFNMAATAVKARENNNLSEKTEKEVEKTVQKIAQRVEASGSGIVQIELGDLRDEMGHARIGRKVLASMNEYLSENSLGSFPAWVLDPFSNPEPRQWQKVWIYKRDGSPKSQVLDAFADPDNADLGSALAMLDNGTPDYQKMSNPQKIALIESIVCARK